jgi:plastocyanin
MKTTHKIMMAALTLAVFCVFTCMNAGAQDEKIVPEMKITGHKVIRLNYTFGVDPATATIKKGTTVIWMNDSRSPAEIEFTGKQVTLACKSPVHFVVNDKGSFTSNKIPQGAVASLCFVEKGEFDYTVRRETPQTAPYEAPKESKGKIIVE